MQNQEILVRNKEKQTNIWSWSGRDYFKHYGWQFWHKCSHTYFLRESVSPSWEANQFSASHKVLHILWNPKVHYYIHKWRPYIQCMKTGLTLNTFLPSKKLCNGQTHQKESLSKCREDAICNNMGSFDLEREKIRQ
jgi:hypothetical protein